MVDSDIPYVPYRASAEDLAGKFADSIMLSANWPSHTTIDFYITVLADDGQKRRILTSRVHLSPDLLKRLSGLILELENKITNPTLKQIIGGDTIGA